MRPSQHVRPTPPDPLRHATVRPAWLAACLLMYGMVIPSPASAQQPKPKPENPSRWGVTVSRVPSWELAPRVRKLLGGDDPDDQVNLAGSEFSIGFVRGSLLGGDWGVSYVSKPYKDGSGATKLGTDCFNQAQTICRPRTEVSATRNVVLSGPEVHWFIRVANVKRIVQVGANVAGGILQTKGTMLKATDRFEPTGFNQNGPTGFRTIHEEETADAKDELFPYFPAFKVEFVASVTVVRGLKVQFADGLNFPSIGPRLTVVYLF